MKTSRDHDFSSRVISRSGGRWAAAALLLAQSTLVTVLLAQPYGEADRGQPGDLMIQDYLRQETAKLEKDFPGPIRLLADWDLERPRLLEEFYDMLGLWPIPEKTPLHATTVRTLDRGEYAVEMVHYQSRPGLYVTANLYRPAQVASGARLPAVLYVCGHSSRGRDGNKTAFQSHGIWFARHGYVCLVVDTLQLGEIAGVHHGTYREARWWWLARGYSPAGVEAWNGIRGLDYLESRPEVDPERIGVTGISGGGATTFWVAAADARVRAAAPVSGMADLESYVTDRLINGHCDCMFVYNTHQWPWTRLAALVAPRPMLFANSDRDPIFPMDANERVINRLERVYSWYGASDLVDSFVSIGGHDYRQDLRQAVSRFFNLHLQGDPRPVSDSEVDLVTGSGPNEHPIPPNALRVFPQDADLPADALNASIDREFVPLAQPDVPESGAVQPWKEQLLGQLRRLTFRHFPERLPAATLTKPVAEEIVWAETEPGIRVRLRQVRSAATPAARVMVFITATDIAEAPPAWLNVHLKESDTVYVVEPRGIGGTRWTRRNPPNYVERAHFLLGRTVDSGRVWDLAALARSLAELHAGSVPVWLIGEKGSAVLGIYAALLEPDIAGLVLHEPPATHMDEAAPALLNVLRVCDIPEAMGLVAPRPLILTGAPGEGFDRVQRIYRLAGAADKVTAVK